MPIRARPSQDDPRGRGRSSPQMRAVVKAAVDESIKTGVSQELSGFPSQDEVKLAYGVAFGHCRKNGWRLTANTLRDEAGGWVLLLKAVEEED